MNQRFLKEEKLCKGFKILSKVVEISLIEIPFLMLMRLCMSVYIYRHIHAHAHYSTHMHITHVAVKAYANLNVLCN